MSEFVLEANQRKVDQQSRLTELRNNSRVPGVIYGFGKDQIVIDVEYNALLKILTEASTSNLIKIKVGGKEIEVIVREYQQDPVTDKLVHVDFMATDPKRELNTVVSLEFVGVSKAVREQGAKLDVKNEKVNVTCLPQDLPAKISLDTSGLNEIGQKLLISDLQVSDKIKITNDPNAPVVSVIMPKKIKLAPIVEAGVEGAEGAEGVEGVEGEAKPAEGEAKKAE